MNTRIANIIISYIEDLSWMDKLAGVTYVAKVNVTSEGKKVEKRFPISCDKAYEDACKEGCYDELAPNSSKRSVVYFEEGGFNLIRHEANKLYYESSLRLVGWLNYKMLRGGGCGSSAKYVTDIIKSLPPIPVTIDDFHALTIEVTSQLPRDASIFSKYTYNEKQTQYLMLPYDFFALEIRTRFFIVPECIELPEEGCTEC